MPRRAVIELKSPGEIDAMRAAGRIVARCLAAVQDASVPGVALTELDAVARAVMDESGAVPAFLDYQPHFASSPFPGVICASVNDAVVHAIPGPYRLVEGDLVSIDCGAFVDGWCGDAAISYVVGGPDHADPGDLALIDTTRAAVAAGMLAAAPGGRMGDIGAAIAAVARAGGYGLLADHGGHGIGRAMHEPPHVPNEARRRSGLRLRAGLVIAIEPMLIAGGGDDYRHDEDGWTLRTADGSRAAHWEHTVAITADGPRVLTLAS